MFILRSCLLASPGFDVHYEALTLSFLLVGEAGNEKPFFSCSSRARFLHWKYFLILLEDCLELLTSPGLVRARALLSSLRSQVPAWVPSPHRIFYRQRVCWPSTRTLLGLLPSTSGGFPPRPASLSYFLASSQCHTVLIFVTAAPDANCFSYLLLHKNLLPKLSDLRKVIISHYSVVQNY